MSNTENPCVVGILKLLRDKLWRIKFEEFKRLIKVLEYNIVAEVVQVKEKPIPATLFGKGKIQEIRKIIEETGAETFIVYNTLKSIQKVNLEAYLGVEVLDRYDVTLEIFSRNASDRVSKLQVELAKISKEIPYVKMLTKIRFQKDRPFFRAGGEYAYVKKVAELRKRRKKLIEEISKLREDKLNKIADRRERGFKIFTVVGYYNAGKTSLFNALTGANKKVSDLPFTTLESKYSRLPELEKVLLVDTIGFVFDLDPQIIKSFEINVDDMRQADGLIIVVDTSENLFLSKLKVDTVLNILRQIGAISKKSLIVALNKIDLVQDELKIRELEEYIKEKLKKIERENVPIVKISAKMKSGLDKLVNEIKKVLRIKEKS